MAVIRDIYREMKSRETEEKEKLDFLSDYDYDNINYRLTDVEKEIVETVNRTHPQLGGLVLWDLVVAFARKGTMKVAVKGTGKSTSQKAVAKGIKGINVIEADGGLTPARIQQLEMEGVLENALIVIDDVTTLFTSAVGELTMEFIGQLLEQKAWYGMVRNQPIIVRANVSALMAGTPWCARVLIKTGLFDSHVSDRIIRLYWCYKNLPEFGEDKRRVTKSYYPKVEVEFREEELPYNVSAEWENRCVDMLSSQFTVNRAVNAVRKLLNAHAVLCNKKVVDDNDAMWLYCYKPFIKIEEMFTFRPAVYESGVLVSGPLVYCDIYPSILGLCSYSPRTPDEIKRVTRFDIVLVNDILHQLVDAGWLQYYDGKFYTVGKWNDELERFHKLFGGDMIGGKD
jgi:hypothetical protein